MSAYSRQVRRNIESHVSRLVTLIVDVEETDENHQTAFEFCMENLTHHNFGSCNRHIVDSLVQELADKMSAQNLAQRARDLDSLYKRFKGFAAKKRGFDEDYFYGIVALLCYLSDTSQILLDGPRSLDVARALGTTPSAESLSDRTFVKAQLARRQSLLFALSANTQVLQEDWEADFVRSLESDSELSDWSDEEGTTEKQPPPRAGKQKRSERRRNRRRCRPENANTVQDSPTADPVSALHRVDESPETLHDTHLIATLHDSEDESTASSDTSIEPLAEYVLRQIDHHRVVQEAFREHQLLTSADADADADAAPAVTRRRALRPGYSRAQEFKKPWNTLHDKLWRRSLDKSIPFRAHEISVERTLVLHVVMMLLDFDTTSFARKDPKTQRTIEAFVQARPLAVAHLSSSSLDSVLSKFIRTANRKTQILTGLKDYSTNALLPGNSQCFQAFVFCVEKMFREIDEELDCMQGKLRAYISFRHHRGNSDVDLRYLLDECPVTLLELEEYLRPVSETIQAVFNVCVQVTRPQSDDNSTSSASWPRRPLAAHQILTELYSCLWAECVAQRLNYRALHQNLLKRLFFSTIAPYLQIMDRWCFRGVLEDPCQEFLVIEHRIVERNALTEWQSRYVLRRNSHGLCAPSFLLPVVEQILQTGKSLNLMHSVAQQKSLYSGAMHMRTRDAQQHMDSFFREEVHRKTFQEQFAHLVEFFLEQGALNRNSQASGSIDFAQTLSERQGVQDALASEARPSAWTKSQQFGHVASTFSRGSSLHALAAFPGVSLAKYDNPDASIQRSDVKDLIASMKTDLNKHVVEPAVRATGLSELADEKFLVSSGDTDDAFLSVITLLQKALLNPVTERYEAVGKHVRQLVVDRCYLIEHLKALKAFFCMGNGEMMGHFASGVFRELDHGTEADLSLDEFLQDSLGYSPVCEQYLGLDLSVTVDSDIRFQSQRRTSIGALESFHFSYKVNWPLNIIISGDSISKYADILIFLLQIKRAKVALETMVARARHIRWSRREEAVVQDFFTLQRELAHFVTGLHDYVLHRVVFHRWHALKDLINDGAEGWSLDFMRRKHDEYVKVIHAHVFLHRSLSTPLKKIKRILDVALKLRTVYAHSVVPLFEPTLSTSGPPVAAKAVTNKLLSVRNELKQNIRFVVIVVEQLTRQGYHPHLEEFLGRINMNGFYDYH